MRSVLNGGGQLKTCSMYSSACFTKKFTFSINLKKSLKKSEINLIEAIVIVVFVSARVRRLFGRLKCFVVGKKKASHKAQIFTQKC